MVRMLKAATARRAVVRGRIRRRRWTHADWCAERYVTLFLDLAAPPVAAVPRTRVLPPPPPRVGLGLSDTLFLWRRTNLLRLSIVSAALFQIAQRVCGRLLKHSTLAPDSSLIIGGRCGRSRPVSEPQISDGACSLVGTATGEDRPDWIATQATPQDHRVAMHAGRGAPMRLLCVQ